MTAIPFRTWTGEKPVLPAHELPEGRGQLVQDADLQHGELKGLRGNATFAEVRGLSAPLRSVYTEDGVNFFGWPYETYPVRSMNTSDTYHRVYYTAMQSDGPIIKVARMVRDTGLKIAGGLVPNFHPPEESDGPDCWLLGVPAPQVRGGPLALFPYPNKGTADVLDISLVDRASYPNIPSLQFRVTFFVEDPTGRIVFQQDITNTEAGISPYTGTSYPQVMYTNESSERGQKIQDMLWPLSPYPYTPKPYKYYWYDPPAYSAAALDRTVDVRNEGDDDIIITYGGQQVAVNPEISDGGGNEA